MKKQSAWSVGNSLGVHPLQEAKVVYMPSSMREELTDMLSGLAILLEVPQWLHYPVLNDLTRLCQSSGIIEPDHFAIIPEEVFLIVVGIHVADTSSHKEKDNALGPGGMVKNFAGRNCAVSPCLLVGEGAHREAAKAAGHIAKGMSAGDIHRWSEALSESASSWSKIIETVLSGFKSALMKMPEVQAGKEALEDLCPGFLGVSIGLQV